MCEWVTWVWITGRGLHTNPKPGRAYLEAGSYRVKYVSVRICVSVRSSWSSKYILTLCVIRGHRVWQNHPTIPVLILGLLTLLPLTFSVLNEWLPPEVNSGFAPLRRYKTVEPSFLKGEIFRDFGGCVLTDELTWSMNYGMDYRAIRTIHHATLLFSPQSNKQLLSSIDPYLLWAVMTWWVSNLSYLIVRLKGMTILVPVKHNKHLISHLQYLNPLLSSI